MNIFRHFYVYAAKLSGARKIASMLLQMKRSHKRLFVAFIDVLLCVFTVWLAYFLRLGYFVPLKGLALNVTLTSVVIALPIFYMFGLYNAVYRYFGTVALISVIKAVIWYGLIFSTIFTLYSFEGIPRTVGLIQPVLLLLIISVSRVLVRLWLNIEGVIEGGFSDENSHRIMIYGTDETGRQLADSLAGDPRIKLCGFLDDDSSLYKHAINGCPVYDPADVLVLANRYQLTDVLIALQTVSRSNRNSIVKKMQGANFAVRVVPNLSDLARGKFQVSELRELDIEDLLGREAVEPDTALFSQNICSQVVMVTGAGGSIGGELSRQIIGQKPKVLLLVDCSEYALYSVHSELVSNNLGETEIIPLLASVCDEARMEKIFQSWAVDTVYHAAAYKHVPMVEHNIEEGVKNNLFGTLHSAQIAQKNNVKNFVLVSSDKAVRPTNVMGACKRLAEISIQALADYNRGNDNSDSSVSTEFSIVRFGNVLNSSGSVVPKFRQQISEGGPVTVTDPNVTRYFMTITEAAQLVIQASSMAKSGDVFLLDMGEPVRIYDLATRMIELSGLTVRNETFDDGDVEIRITGLRPGEKLYEELLIGDGVSKTEHPRIMKGSEPFVLWDELEPKLDQLKAILNTNNILQIHNLIRELVEGYQPSSEIVDWLYKADNTKENSSTSASDHDGRARNLFVVKN